MVQRLPKANPRKKKWKTPSVILLNKTCFLKITHPFIQTKTECQTFDIKNRDKSLKKEQKMGTKSGFLLEKILKFKVLCQTVYLNLISHDSFQIVKIDYKVV